MASTLTIGARLDAVNGRPSGFDYMKVSLAAVVILVHTVSTSYGQAADGLMWDSPARPFLRAVLPMFFGLSGFLVAASLDRSKTLIKFLGLRVIRIFPALTVEVLLSAFIIGPLLSTYALGQYFSDPLFFSYLLNAVGEIHYLLPGLFADNPNPHTVNAQLWTVPYELYAYISFGVLMTLGIRKHRIVAPLAVVALCGLHFVGRLAKHDWRYVPFDGGVPGSVLVIAAVVGFSIYYYRDLIPWKWSYFWTTAVVALAGMYSTYGGEYFAALLVPYAAVFLGLKNPGRAWFVRGSDYSYGLYLYGFIVQQTYAAIAPPALHLWWLNAVVCLPATAVLAVLSWHMVEKPVQKLKVPIGKAEQWYLAKAAAAKLRRQAGRAPSWGDARGLDSAATNSAAASG